MSNIAKSHDALRNPPPIAPAPEMSDAERAAAIRANVAELLGPVIEYVNAQHKLGFTVGFTVAGDPGALGLQAVPISKVL